MPNIRRISYIGFCRNCKHLNNFSGLISLESEIDDLSVDELSKIIHENGTWCPVCENRGTISIVLFKRNDLIIDMQRRLQQGMIILNVEKTKSQFDKWDLAIRADNSNFTLYDHYNALTIFKEELEKLKSQDKSNKPESQILKCEPEGGLIFSAKLIDESPYVTASQVITYGFSYEEIAEILMDLEKQMIAQLKEDNMPY